MFMLQDWSVEFQPSHVLINKASVNHYPTLTASNTNLVDCLRALLLNKASLSLFKVRLLRDGVKLAVISRGGNY